MRTLCAAVSVLIAIQPLAARSLESEVKRILAQSAIARQGFVGILVVDDHGRKLVSVNAGRLFVPASNTKLFSTALALERLGADKRFETRVEKRGKDLVLIGAGDANLSGRILPYAPDSQPAPALTVIDDLATQIAAHGIQSVEGDIIGDDTAFLYQPYASGWTVEDAINGDGPATSALVVNDNIVHLRIQSAPQPVITIDPDLPIFHLDAQVSTGPEDRIEATRPPDSNILRVRGTLKSTADSLAYSEEWAVGDPALFAALALKDALTRRGISVNGSVRALHREAGLPFLPAPAGDLVAVHQSLPLIEDLRLTNKISQNLHADLLLSDVAGSRSAGLEALAAFLTQVGVNPGEYRFYDGSGLSRTNLVSPEAVVTLLGYMAHADHATQWFSTLPIGGVDGSLQHRFTGPKVKGRIRAKTGGLMHVSALSGYAEARHEKQLTFSIFVNNSLADSAGRIELIDRICAALVK